MIRSSTSSGPESPRTYQLGPVCPVAFKARNQPYEHPKSRRCLKPEGPKNQKPKENYSPKPGSTHPSPFNGTWKSVFPEVARHGRLLGRSPGFKRTVKGAGFRAKGSGFNMGILVDLSNSSWIWRVHCTLAL